MAFATTSSTPAPSVRRSRRHRRPTRVLAQARRLAARRALNEQGSQSPADWAQLRLEGLAARALSLQTTGSPNGRWLPWAAWIAVAVAVVILACWRRGRRT